MGICIWNHRETISIKMKKMNFNLLKVTPFFFLCGIVLLLFLVASAYGDNFYLDINSGIGLSRIKNSKKYSPVKGLNNYYHSESEGKTIFPLLGLGVGYKFNSNNHYYASFGVEADYVDFGKIKGSITQAINFPFNSDKISYSYSARSYFFMLKGKLGFVGNKFLPYISLGFGFGVNSLEKYSENNGNNISASYRQFTKGSKHDIAYAIGIGLFQYDAGHNMSLNVEYRFINAGRGVLKNPLDGSNSIYSGALEGHFITFILTL